MIDTGIRNALRRLPRASASPHFTPEVLHAVRARERRPLVWRRAAAFAASLCLLAVIVHAALAASEQQKIRALRAEHQRIESELQQVKAAADDAPPVLVLENDDTGLVVDVADRHPNDSRSNIYY